MSKLAGIKGFGTLSGDQISNVSNLAGLATSVIDNINPKQDVGFSSSKYGKAMNQGLAANNAASQVANIGFNPQLMAATGGLSAVAGGAIKLATLADKANTDKFGRKKSLGVDAGLRAAIPIANLYSGFKNLNNKDLSTKEKIMSFTPLAGIVQNKIANKQKDLYDRSESMKQAQELKAQSSNIYGFSKGGKLVPISSCGCDKGSDGIDTDIFKRMEPKAYMEVQRYVGIKPTGKYTDTDKATMKAKAKQSGGTLRSYLESSPKVRLMIGLAEGGIIKSIYKAGGAIRVSY
jgi:hypothetical protein